MLLLLNGLLAVTLSFTVTHDHGIKSCTGKLTLDDDGVTFDSERKDHSRHWKYTDIQELRLTPDGIRVLTYEDRRLSPGERPFEFTMEKYPWQAVRDMVAPHLDRRLVVEHVEETKGVALALFHAEVKHRHLRGGCNGELTFAAENVTFASKEEGHSRTWTYRDIENISSSGPYELTVVTYSGDKNYQFQLKEPLEEKVYNELWRRLYRDRISRLADEAVDRIRASAEPPRAPPAPVSNPLTVAAAPDPLPAILQSLARVESGGNALALSPKGARGIMQFMPETARRYGLRVDAKNDERTDPAKSAAAATRYLQDLFAHFGDWQLALAGYNAGESRVEQAIHRSGLREFDHLLGFLPEETRRYVPAVMSRVPAEAPVPANPSGPAQPARVFALLAP